MGVGAGDQERRKGPPVWFLVNHSLLDLPNRLFFILDPYLRVESESRGETMKGWRGPECCRDARSGEQADDGPGGEGVIFFFLSYLLLLATHAIVSGFMIYNFFLFIVRLCSNTEMNISENQIPMDEPRDFVTDDRQQGLSLSSLVGDSLVCLAQESCFLAGVIALAASRLALVVPKPVTRQRRNRREEVQYSHEISGILL